jgi:hypothetical protein
MNGDGNTTPPAPGAPGHAAARRDEAARLSAAIEQGTGRAIELARLGSAFFLEAVRAGTPQGEAVQLAAEYVKAELADKFMRDHLRERLERGEIDK